MPVWAAFTLIVIGLGAIFIEFFVPAFGLVALGGVASIVGAVVLTYRDQPEPWGLIVLVTALAVTPTVLIIGFRRFPKSFFGRRLILSETQNESPAENSRNEGDLVGAVGRAVTPLHPSGIAEIGERRCSVVTGGEFLDAGTEVVVTAVHGSRIVVRDAREVG